VRVSEGIDADDLGFADPLQEIGHHFIELVVADLDAIRVADGFDLDLAVALLRRDFERRVCLLDQHLAWLVVAGYLEVHLHFCAADVAMGFTVCVASCGIVGSPAPGVRAAVAGITIFSPQDGN